MYVCCVAPVFYPAQCFALIRALSAVFVPKTGANLRGRPPRTTPTANIQVGLYMVGLYTAHHASAIRQALPPDESCMPSAFLSARIPRTTPTVNIQVPLHGVAGPACCDRLCDRVLWDGAL